MHKLLEQILELHQEMQKAASNLQAEKENFYNKTIF